MFWGGGHLNNNPNKKHSKLKVITLVVLLFLCLAGLSYAFFLWQYSSPTSSSITTPNVSFRLLESNKEVFSITPMTDEEGMNSSDTQGNILDFEIKSETVANMDVKYTVRLQKLDIDAGMEQIPDNEVKVYVEDFEGNTILKPTKVSELNDYVLFEKTHKHNETKQQIRMKYKLKVWLDESVSIFNNENRQFKFKIGVVNRQLKQETGETYNLIYNTNGGTEVSSTTFKDGESVTITSSSPTKSGYTFKGWSRNKNATTATYKAGDKVTFDNVYNNKVTLYAVWSANGYKLNINKGTGVTTIYYKINDDTSYTSSTSNVSLDVKYNKKYYYYGVASNGYTIGTCTEEKPCSGTMGAEAITKELSASLNTYTISYNLNGGTNPSGVVTSYNVETATFNLSTPTKTGYTFDGWYENSGLTGTKVTQIAKGSTGNKTYYAKWTANTDTKYTVKHWQQNIDAGATQNSTNYTLKDTDNLTGTTGASITPSVKTYTGFTSPSKQTTTILADGSRVIDYYYTRNSYSVTLNKGTGISSVTGVGTYQYGKSVTIDATVSTGYTWKNWSGTHSTTTQKYTFTMPASNVTDTANANIINYTVNVVVQRGTVDSATKQVPYNTNITFNLTPTVIGATSTVSCTNNQTGTITNNVLTVKNVLSNTTCTVKFVDTVTTLYEDGTLIINESMANRSSNITKHGTVENEYEAMSDTNSYVLTSDSKQPWYNEREQITSVEIGQEISPVETRYWFYELENIGAGSFTNLDTSNVTDMRYMFAYAGKSATTFELIGLDSWDTSSVIDMGGMFRETGYNATKFSLSLSNWDTSSVTDMQQMFFKVGYSATTWNIGNLSNWNTSKVKSMNNMFSSAGYSATTFSLDLSNWDTRSVTNMNSMFWYTGYSATTFKLTGLNSWDTSSVTNMKKMFSGAGYSATTFTLDLSNWDTQGATDMADMFASAGYSAEVWCVSIPQRTGTLTNTTSIWYGSSSDIYAEPLSGKSFTFTSCNAGYAIEYNLNGGTISNENTSPTSAKIGEEIKIYNPKKSFTITGDANGTGATVGSSTSGTIYYSEINITNYVSSTAKYLETGGSDEYFEYVNFMFPMAFNSSSTPYITYKNLGTPGSTVNFEFIWENDTVVTPTITKTGYNCGWATSKTATDYEVSSGESYMVDNSTPNNVTLYGVCKPKTYTISYNLNGGTNSSDAVTSYNIETELFDLPTPTKTGYTFDGWYESSDLSGTKVTQIAKGSSGNKTYYAKWNINKVTIKYSTNGGVITSSTSGGEFTESSNTIYKNNSVLTHVIEYGATMDSAGLVNYNNTSYVNITKTGYSAPSNNEWKCLSGCSTSDKTYDQNVAYEAKDFCDLSKKSCEVLLGVNWIANEYTVKFYADGNHIDTANTVLEVLGGRTFYKKYDGLAIVGYLYDGNYTGPVLLGKTADSVAYYTSVNDTIFTYSGTISYNNTTYYYSSTEYWMAGNLTDTSGANRNKYESLTIKEAATQLASLYTDTFTKTYTYDSKYTNLPSLTRTGDLFLGWFSSNAKNDSSVAYKDHPWYYYADANTDIYNAMKYDEKALINHYVNYGKDENRRTSEYVSTDKVSILKNMSFYGGWYTGFSGVTKNISFNIEYDTSTFSAPSSSNKSNESISSSSLSVGYSGTKTIIVTPATPYDRYTLSDVVCTNGVTATYTRGENRDRVEVVNNSATTDTSSTCTITYTPKWEGIPTSTYSANGTITYAGKEWTVTADNGDDTSLALNGVAGSGAYKADVKSELNNASVNTDISGGGIVKQTNGAYVSTNSGTSTNYSSVGQLYWSGSGNVITNVAINKYVLGSTHKFVAGHKSKNSNTGKETTTYWTATTSFATSYTSSVAYAAGSSITATDTDTTVVFTDGTLKSTSMGYMSGRYIVFNPNDSDAAASSKKLPMKRWVTDLDSGDYTTEPSYMNTTKTWKIYDCGNEQHGKAYTFTAVDSDEYKYTSQNGNSDTPAYGSHYWRWYFASSATSTTTGTASSNLVRTYRLDTSSNCKTRTKYTKSNLTKTIYYRPYLIVRER